MSESFFTLPDKTRLFYQDEGEGFPIVFLHGNGLSSRYFTKQRPLAHSYRLIFVDSRGHGRSERGYRPLTFEQMAHDLEALLAHLEIKHCLLVGHSDGANLALVYTHLFPSRVSGILFNGGNVRVADLPYLVNLSIGMTYFLQTIFAPICPRIGEKKDITALMMSDLQIDKRDLNAMAIPVILLYGRWDIIKKSAMKELADALPKSELILLKGAGHHPAKSQSFFFNHTIQTLVASIL